MPSMMDTELQAVFFFLCCFWYSPVYQLVSTLHCASNRRSSYLSFLLWWPLTSLKIVSILLFLCVWYISLVISHSHSKVVFGHRLLYNWRSVHWSTNSSLSEKSVLCSFHYSKILEKEYMIRRWWQQGK